MYRLTEVIPALINRVGFQQPTRADYAGIYSPENIESKSGRYFDEAHAAVTVENIREVVIAEPNISREDFNAYIDNLKKSVIKNVLDGIFGEPELIEQNLEFNLCDHRPVPILNTGKFVGRQIRVAPDASKSVTIRAVTLLFDGPATFDLYLFNSVKKAPMKTEEVTTEADNQVVVALEDWVLNYMDSVTKSGMFYLGYFQDDLGTVRAYDEQPGSWNLGKVYGSSCIEAVRVPDVADFSRYNPGFGGRTYGLNVEYSSANDFTERILRNKSAFDKAISLQMAAIVVEKMVYTLRSNGVQRFSEAKVQQLYTELNAEEATEVIPVSNGLKKQLNKELQRLHANFFPKQRVSSSSVLPPCSI